jgi:hypothetical protein
MLQVLFGNFYGIALSVTLPVAPDDFTFCGGSWPDQAMNFM